MIEERKQRFKAVDGLPYIAGHKVDDKGFVYLTEREALYERSVGRISQVRARKQKALEPESDVA
jgi:hypothetical protein